MQYLQEALKRFEASVVLTTNVKDMVYFVDILQRLIRGFVTHKINYQGLKNRIWEMGHYFKTGMSFMFLLVPFSYIGIELR